MSTENKSLTDRIADRINPSITSQTGLTKSGSMSFSSVEQIMEFAKVMSIASVAIPKHLRENPGACLAVAIQASEWEMSPFSVANKSYVVNDRIAYEAQLINAVILRRAPIVGRFKISYSGEGETRKCKVAAKLTDGDLVEYESPTFKTIPVKNSPLWKGDPDQQLFYYSSRAMCRRHFPDVLLGVYAVDELQDTEKEITGTTRPVIDTSKSAQIEETTEAQRDIARSQAATAEYVAAEKKAKATRKPTEKLAEPETRESNAEPKPAERLAFALEEAGHTPAEALAVLVTQKLAKPGWCLADVPDATIARLLENFSDLSEEIAKSKGGAQ